MSDKGRDLDMFISGWNRPISSNTENRIRTKCAHIFNYEDGTLVERNPKESEYSKSLEFVKKNFKKAAKNFLTQRKKVDKEKKERILKNIDGASTASELYSVYVAISE
jgi:hypothetical protein